MLSRAAALGLRRRAVCSIVSSLPRVVSHAVSCRELAIARPTRPVLMGSDEDPGSLTDDSEFMLESFGHDAPMDAAGLVEGDGEVDDLEEQGIRVVTSSEPHDASEAAGSGSRGHTLPPEVVACNNAIVDLIAEAPINPDVMGICSMLEGCRNNLDVRRVLNDAFFTHPLTFDVLNGHGFRVHVLAKLTAIATKTKCAEEWFDVVAIARHHGFVLARNYAATGFELLRGWLLHRFNLEGRNPQLGSLCASRLKQLIAICREDGVVFDSVLFARSLSTATAIVSTYDRQNRYRIQWPDDLPRRDGVVMEWVIGHERATDFDRMIQACDTIVDDLLEHLATTINCRPSFNVAHRLMDYYFATDNIEKLVAVLEDCDAMGIGISDASTAKMMQLAVALNLPDVPDLFQRWRVRLPQCSIAPPDVSRMLLYYSRSGGGLPCPTCGEPFNHRNVSLAVYAHTPSNQLECPELKCARRFKGELEDRLHLPQNKDWSEVAFTLLRYSDEVMMVWGPSEWRAFLLCCIHSLRASEARALIDERLPASKWDDFLRMTYIRSLRLACPESILPTITAWDSSHSHISPMVLQEALMGAACISDDSHRLATWRDLWGRAKRADIYILPYTKRFISARHQARVERQVVVPDEATIFQELMDLMPRHFTQFQLRDSSLDVVPSPSKKSHYSPKSREQVAAIRQQRAAAANEHT